MSIDPQVAARFDELDAAIERHAAAIEQRAVAWAAVGGELDWQDDRRLDGAIGNATDAVRVALRALHAVLPGTDTSYHACGVARKGRIYARTPAGEVVIISTIESDDGTLARLATEAGNTDGPPLV